MSGQTIDTAKIDAKISSRAAAQLKDEGGNAALTTSATQGVYGAWVQIVAAVAHTVTAIEISIQAGTSFERVAVSIGTPGNEPTGIVKVFRIYGGTTVSLDANVDPSLIPKGSRVSVAGANDTGAGATAINVSVVLEEAND